ncbi:MAG: Aspartyl/glutamyl-tRNA(Asn/Gln) amidotransferase subunit B [Candidatus Hydrogenedentes bacterium ADurb.Bin101]|nr:MAG: Aspartyl/glutamyl-tRNA(Asn/Gln) amidotransferase subunit B [Candidatus Hydrogenedentes bacterium ADurb.Bin101]
MFTSGQSPDSIVQEKGLNQISDTGAIEDAVKQVIGASPNQVAQYKEGKEKVFGYFVGQVMKATQGKGNPQLVNEILRRELGR